MARWQDGLMGIRNRDGCERGYGRWQAGEKQVARSMEQGDSEVKDVLKGSQCRAAEIGFCVLRVPPHVFSAGGRLTLNT